MSEACRARLTHNEALPELSLVGAIISDLGVPELKLSSAIHSLTKPQVVKLTRPSILMHRERSQ